MASDDAPRPESLVLVQCGFCNGKASIFRIVAGHYLCRNCFEDGVTAGMMRHKIGVRRQREADALRALINEMQKLERTIESSIRNSLLQD
jgi:hypothetical protein